MNIEDFKSNIKWWESKRLAFNIIVGSSGILGIFLGLSGSNYPFTLEDLIGIFIWGIGANILFSLGILVEIFDWYYFKNKIKIRKYRFSLFAIGTVFSFIWTLWFSWIYYAFSFF